MPLYVCVCVCVQMALKADLMLGLRHQNHNSRAVSLKDSLHHFRCKNLYLVLFLFLHVYMNRLKSAVPVSGT